ncbi:MAG: sulfotransferase family 2 domain-containing protein [Pseudomonadota bacterium]
MNLEEGIKRKLLFSHVPKAGGSSIHVLFRHLMGANHVYRMRSRHLDSRPTLEHLTDLEKQSYLVFHGHFAYGVHAIFSEPCAYLSVVRDPIDRIVSLYRFTRESGREDRRERAMQMGFAEFFETEWKRRNLPVAQMRMVTKEVEIEKAKAVIDNHYLMICSTRQQKDMQDLLLAMLGGQDRKTVHANRSQGTPVDKDEIAAIRKKYGARLEADNWLVSYAEAAFDAVRERYERNPFVSPPDLSDTKRVRKLRRIDEEYDAIDKKIAKLMRKDRAKRRQVAKQAAS